VNLEKHVFFGEIRRKMYFGRNMQKGTYMFLHQTCYGKLKPIMRLLRLLFKISRLEVLEFEVG
jgi:hypothetical protein